MVTSVFDSKEELPAAEVTVVPSDKGVDANPEESEAGSLPTKKTSPAAKVLKKKKWKKPKDKPKRPLSAYNIFFRHEREKLLYARSMEGERAQRSKLGFADLAKNVAAKWKQLDAHARKIYEAQAEFEQIRYKAEVEDWKRNQNGGGGAGGASLLPYRKPSDCASGLIKALGQSDSILENLISQQHCRDALISHLMISQLMANNYGNSNSGGSGTRQSHQMGQMYSNPIMVNAEVQNQIKQLTGGEGSLEPLLALASTNSGAAAGSQRRMSMPTSSGHFAQMNHERAQQNAMQQHQMASIGGRRLSMPLGIIEHTNPAETPCTERRSSMPLDACGYSQHHQQQHEHHHHQQYEQHHHQQDHHHHHQQHEYHQQQEQEQQGQEQREQQLRYLQEYQRVGDIRAQLEQQLSVLEQHQNGLNMMVGGQGRRMSMPSNMTGHASLGRRMSMPLSVEQQVLDRGGIEINPHSASSDASNPQQHRSMSMPLGMSETMVQDPRAHENLDELADILRDDTELFDW